MKYIASFVRAVLLLLIFSAPAARGEDIKERLSVLVQFTGAQGKVSSTTVSKCTLSDIILPVSVSDSSQWIVTLIKISGQKTFYVSLTDPSMRDQKGADLKLFAAEFEVNSGKQVTVLKTDQYKLDVTLTVE